jgi:hypothetical protein
VGPDELEAEILNGEAPPVSRKSVKAEANSVNKMVVVGCRSPEWTFKFEVKARQRGHTQWCILAHGKEECKVPAKFVFKRFQCPVKMVSAQE